MMDEPSGKMLNALCVYPDFAGTHIIKHSVDKLPDAFKAMRDAAIKEIK